MSATDRTFRVPDVAEASGCPTCHALTGHPCRFGDRVVPSHPARIDMAESLQKAVDLVYACHILDQVGRDAAWEHNLGDSRN